MGIKKYFASKDTSITNSFDTFLVSRQTSGNTGASDILETYALYGRNGTSVLNNELSRVLIQFDHSVIAGDITSGLINSSTVKYYLRLFNAAHGETLPKNFTLQVMALTRAWDEGNGLDMENYSDQGGASWVDATSSTSWGADGGDYNTSVIYTQVFESGAEDLEIDITTLVAGWIAGTRTNYGVIVKMMVEDAEESFYTKRFFARKSHYFFSRPIIEARFEEDPAYYSVDFRDEKDGRDNFYFSSSLASASDNTNYIYMYNFVRGQLKDVPGYTSTGNHLYVRIYNDDRTLCLSSDTPIMAMWVRTGVYVVDVILAGDYVDDPTIRDCWYLTATDAEPVWIGDITTKSVTDEVPDYSVENKEEAHYVIKIKNFKADYRNDEVVKFRTFIRKQDWEPNRYMIYWNDFGDDKEIVEDLYYKIYRLYDNFEVVGYSHLETIDFSHVCYDDVSNFFTFDMASLEPEWAYAIKFLYASGDSYIENDEIFKFRVADVGLWKGLEG
jgi:hypothetical protein